MTPAARRCCVDESAGSARRRCLGRVGSRSCGYLLGQQAAQFLLGVAQAAFYGFQRGAGEGGDLRYLELAVQAQQEDFALVFGQVLQGGVEARLVAAQAQLLLGAGAAVGLGVQLLIVAVVQGVVDAVLAPVVDQAVAGDLEQPRTKTRPALWLGVAADQAEPGVLVDLFGQFGLVAQGHEKAVQALAVARIQGFECASVTGSVAGQQRFVAG